MPLNENSESLTKRMGPLELDLLVTQGTIISPNLALSFAVSWRGEAGGGTLHSLMLLQVISDTWVLPQPPVRYTTD